MNTERLFTITKQLKNEIVEMKLVKTLNSLHDQLQTAINSPSVDHQRAVETTLNNLHQSLTQAPSNKFSPGFLLNIKTLRVSNRTTVSDLFGKGLSEKLKNIFEDGYTSVQTLDRLANLRQDLAAFLSGLEGITSGFDAIGIHDESSEPGSSVVGMTIPRENNDVSMREFQKEMAFWGQFLSELSEVVEGSVVEHKVYSLHSSGLGIDVYTTLNIAAQVSAIVVAIYMTLEKLQKFRKLKEDAEELSIEKEAIDNLVKKGKKVMEDRLDEIQVEIFQNCKMEDKIRLQELRNGVRLRLNGLSNRLERGFQFEVRTSLPAEATTEDQAQEKIASSLRDVHFKYLEGTRLLDLPEPDPDEEKTKKPAKKVPKSPPKPPITQDE